MSAQATPSFRPKPEPKQELKPEPKVFDKGQLDLKYYNIRGITAKPRKGKLDNCPGVHFTSASGKIMRPIPKYFKKEEEVMLAGDPYMLNMQLKSEKKPGK